MYNRTPSEVLRIEDEYTAFCFDEACAFIRAKMEHPKKPEQPKFRKHYSSFADLYKAYK
jgi:hypothetical protein